MGETRCHDGGQKPTRVQTHVIKCCKSLRRYYLVILAISAVHRISNVGGGLCSLQLSDAVDYIAATYQPTVARYAVYL